MKRLARIHAAAFRLAYDHRVISRRYPNEASSDEQHLDHRIVRHERGNPPPGGVRKQRCERRQHRRAAGRRHVPIRRTAGLYAAAGRANRKRDRRHADGGDILDTLHRHDADPSAPFANQDGLVAAPNVDLAQEMVSQLVARYSFAANAKVMAAGRSDDEDPDRYDGMTRPEGGAPPCRPDKTVHRS